MSMPRQRRGSDNLFLVLSSLGALQFIAAGLAVVFGFHEAEIPIAFGLSIGRIALAAVAFAAAACTLWGGILLFRRKPSLQASLDAAPAPLRRWISVAGVLAVGFFWISVFSPASVFGDYASHFLRLRPLVVAASLLACELWIATGLHLSAATVWSEIRALPARIPLVPGVGFLLLLAAWLAVLITKFGIVKIGPFWNPPGVPLTGLQGIGILVLVGLGALVSTGALPSPSSRTRGRYGWLLPVALYACALLLWGLAPMERHYFSLRPGPPSFQPYPFSDARSHDLGALSILDGQGIFFHGFTDKPLYMVFLALLHVIGGDDYVLLIWLQLAVLALVPVVLYYLGRAVRDEVLGAAVALLTILQQRNSILAARQIDSVNARLLMTEVPTLLFMTLVAYLVFRWFATREARYALASGAAIGAASLIRANPVFVLPVVGLFAIVALRPVGRQMFRHLLIFSVGFLVLFSPWLATGVNESGVPWFWVKFQFVIGQRFQSRTLPADLAYSPATAPTGMSGSVAGSGARNIAYSSSMQRVETPQPGDAADSARMAVASGAAQTLAVPAVIPRAASHSLHNAISALLSLPDVFNLDSLDQLSQVPPWGDTTWQGNLTPTQHLAVVVNLLLLALGLAWAWRRFRWSGLAPLLVFLGYDLSLAVATTSGGRYIVPVNWVAHFYWVLGWVALVDAMAHIPSASAAGREASLPASDHRRLQGMWTWVAVVLFMAAWIPVANVVVPKLVPPHLESAARAALAPLTPAATAGERVVYGKVLYPYYHRKNRSVSFHFLDDRGYEADLVVPRSGVLPFAALRSGTLGAVVLTSDDQLKAAKSLYVAPPR